MPALLKIPPKGDPEAGDTGAPLEACAKTDWSGLTKLENKPDGGDDGETLLPSPALIVKLPKSDGAAVAVVVGVF